ncbi:alpha/beta-tubulin-N-acetyltransferase 9 isoform X2 [Linepithema humile]|uniref:alpha/beta-tubulin-N-acetyltransferase 9 isoform X2 n=1 Tax=Linepithema humile TaxID=83485 RepID=UPI00351F67EF
MRTNMNTRINGTNVILVPYQEKHVTKYHEWMKNPTLQYLTGSEPLTLEQEFEMQKRWLEDKDNAMIGDTNLFLNEPQESCIAEVEIMIADEASRGKKRGWESVILMMCYGIEMLNINKLRAKIKTDNAISIKIFEKLGFQEVGKSEVFQEVTLEKEVSSDWMNWLHSKLQSITSDSN